jgi:hypothetical protein
MTHIVRYKTKKELKEALKHEPHTVYFEDPSIFPGAWSGYAPDMNIGQKFTCTNHPRRSWFALVERRTIGWRVS